MSFSQDQLGKHYNITTNGGDASFIKWYTARPYGFRFVDSSGNATIMYLPILPQNLQISTQFATRLTNTLYGVVEQHSEVKYYDISIQGTTGMVPQYSDNQDSKANILPTDPNPGRQQFSNNSESLVGSIGGALPQATNIINQIANKAQQIVGGGEVNYSGVSLDNNGYVAFHNFYRFLLEYKKQVSAETGSAGSSVSASPLASANSLMSKVASSAKSKIGLGRDSDSSGSSPLQFLNYKDGNQYDCVVNDFRLVRSANSPFLYNYTITIRAYNLAPINQLGFQSLNAIKEQTETGGIKSFKDISRVVGNASALVSGLF